MLYKTSHVLDRVMLSLAALTLLSYVSNYGSELTNMLLVLLVIVAIPTIAVYILKVRSRNKP